MSYLYFMSQVKSQMVILWEKEKFDQGLIFPIRGHKSEPGSNIEHKTLMNNVKILSLSFLQACDDLVWCHQLSPYFIIIVLYYYLSYADKNDLIAHIRREKLKISIMAVDICYFFVNASPRGLQDAPQDATKNETQSTFLFPNEPLKGKRKHYV